jgi:hypothetical protein
MNWKKCANVLLNWKHWKAIASGRGRCAFVSIEEVYNEPNDYKEGRCTYYSLERCT